MLLSLTAPAAAAPCASSSAATPHNARAIRLELRCLINAERSERGLRRLRPNGALARAARRHAHDMIRRRYFSHYSRAGKGPASRAAGAGYLRHASAYTIGENIGWVRRRDVGSIVAAWMRSGGHRHLMLSPRFHELGIGVARSSPSGDGRGLTVVIDFGRRSLARRLR